MRLLTRFFAELGRMGFFLWNVIAWMWRRVPDGQQVLEHSHKIGVQSLPVVVVVSGFVGFTMTIVGHTIFREFGGQDMIGVFVGLSCLREFGPILAGAMLAAKPGTDITASIATMRVKQQIDALEVMAVNPYWYLMAPRFAAFMLVTPAIIIFAVFSSIMAGCLVSMLQLGVSPGVFLADASRFSSMTDFSNGMIKGLIFATLVCWISAYCGFHSEPGPSGVSKAINRAVVLEAALIVVVNYFLTEVMYGYN